MGLAVQECDMAPAVLQQAEQAFLTNVRMGVRPITRIGTRTLQAGHLTLQLRQRVADLEA
jgi:branched-subunit amino acid aminotransferase/4-amino-4-deoxychorismate lyase